jgi:hypothetical protein
MRSGGSPPPRTFHDQHCCLTANDSAVTAPRPPDLGSYAKVMSRWAIRMNSSRMNANFNHLRRIHKTAQQRPPLPKSTIRHRQLIYCFSPPSMS